MPWPRCAEGPRPGQRRTVRQETRLVTGPAGSRWPASSFIPNGPADSPSLPGSAIPSSCALQRREAPVCIGATLFSRSRAAQSWSGAVIGGPVPDGLPHNRRAGGMLFRAKAVAFRSPHYGGTSTTVGGTRSCRAARSARHPVKVEVAGSNPVRTAGIPGEVSLGSQPGQVAQSV
jgi:hypothetical protein